MKKWSYLNIEKGRMSTLLTMAINIEKCQHLTLEEIMQMSHKMDIQGGKRKMKGILCPRSLDTSLFKEEEEVLSSKCCSTIK